MIPTKFWQPWLEIDPTLGHGGIPGELGDYVGARLGDNPQTKNIDMVMIFNTVRDSAAALSTHPYANVEGPPERGLVEETLKALNWILERMMDRTKVNSTSIFTWCHATPPMVDFAQRPIRYPLRSDFAQQAIYHLLGDMVEIAELNSNAHHSCMDPSSALRVMNPLLHLKGNIIKDWFDQEVAGELTLAELNEIFAGIATPGPSIVPAGQSQTPPSLGDTIAALSGVSLVQWYPGTDHWAIFGRKHTELYKPERIWQPEGTGSATEDIAPHNPVRPAVVTPG